MARKAGRAYYDHDDRTERGTHIRKVSFMNGSGRIRKNKRPDQIVIRCLGDDDVVMGGSERPSWKGNPRQRKNIGRRPGSPVQGGLPKPLLPNDWFQIRIQHGSKYEKKYILQLLLNYVKPFRFIPNSYTITGKDIVFYIDDYEVARKLRGANRKIRFDDGFMMEIKVKEGFPPPVPIDDAIKEKIKLVMAKRYIAENKALDLSKFSADPDFAGEMFCPLARPAILKVVLQIISQNISDLVALNLNNNRISSIDVSLSLETKKLKNLKILHLGENRIKSVHMLNCFKELDLTELVLKKNPLVNFFKDNAHYVRYAMSNGVTEIRKKFPKLIKLDDMELPPVISFDVTEEAKLPSPQAAFMCNPDGRDIVKAFLSQYFAIFDSDNRLDLAQAYHDNSSFSITAYYHPNQNTNINKLGTYFKDSRNLFRVKEYPRRKERLHSGKDNIVKFLSTLPKSQHDLSSFVVDLNLFTPALLNLSVNGVFREPSFSTVASAWPVRHFARTFLIVPVGQGFCIINDILFLTNATDSEIQCSFKEEQKPTVLQSPVAGQPGPSEVTAVANTMQAIQLDESVRVGMVQTLATRTGMNLEWSKKCLDETQWDFDRAIWTFTELQSKGSIPAEAFVK